MKNLFLTSVFLLVSLLVFGCGDFFYPGYTLELPQVPKSWTTLLGEPSWRVEWLDSGGRVQKIDIPPGTKTAIDIPVTWVNPVTAWPWWPEHGLIPGFFMPAGALFPFDVAQEGRLRLTWEAGHDTVFYRELALANTKADASRNPANFDWMRFRELFRSGVLSEAVCKDPWLVDWKNAAEKAVSSGFNRRNLVPQAEEKVSIPVPAGPWYGSSPFAEPLVFEEDNPVFPIRPGVNVWISEAGILRVSGTTWVFAKRRGL